MPEVIPPESALLIVYPAEDPNGQLLRSKTLSGTSISTAGWSFSLDSSPRETARWQGALGNLVKWKWVMSVGIKGEVFEVTGTGYKMADMLKDRMDINTENDPLDELKEFEN